MTDAVCRTIRVPRQLLDEFHKYVVIPDGRSEAEIVRSLMSAAISKAKEQALKLKSDISLKSR